MKRWRSRGETGVALVEFALILPFLALLAFATVDLGRVYTLQHRLANASREGAAFAQYYPGKVSNSGVCADPNNIRYRALSEDGGTAAGFVVTVTNAATGASIAGPCTTTGIAPGTRLKVTVQAEFVPVTAVAKPFVGPSKTIKRSTEVVVQG